MDENVERASARARAILLGTVLVVLSACAVDVPQRHSDVARRIELAADPRDHAGLAARFEQQAASDRAAAERHRGYAAAYRNEAQPGNDRDPDLVMARHCDRLAATYEQTAAENLALARMHRHRAGSR